MSGSASSAVETPPKVALRDSGAEASKSSFEGDVAAVMTVLLNGAQKVQEASAPGGALHADGPINAGLQAAMDDAFSDFVFAPAARDEIERMAVVPCPVPAGTYHGRLLSGGLDVYVLVDAAGHVAWFNEKPRSGKPLPQPVPMRWLKDSRGRLVVAVDSADPKPWLSRFEIRDAGSSGFSLLLLHEARVAYNSGRAEKDQVVAAPLRFRRYGR